VAALAFHPDRADRATARVLRHLLGGEARLKWLHGQSPLARVAQEHGAQLRGLNLEYSDAQLVGFVAYAPVEKIHHTMRGAAEALKRVADGSVEKHDVERAVATARFEIADAVGTLDARMAKIGEEVGKGTWARECVPVHMWMLERRQ